MRTILNTLAKRPFLFVILVFLGVHLLVWSQTGIVTNQEATKYIRQGTLLFETGHLGAAKYLVYLPVILLVWCCKATGLPLELIAGVQVIIAGIALLAFYSLINLFSTRKTAFLGTLLLAGFEPLQQWNLYLFADSLFISFSIFLSLLVAKSSRSTLSPYPILLPALCLFVFSRPHALLFIPPVIIYLLASSKSPGQWLQAALAGTAFLAGMLLLANRIFTGGEDMNLMLPFIEEHIICFVPEFPGGNPSLNLSHDGSPISQLFYYIIHNPAHFLRLTAMKLLNFFNLCRPYYSGFHNACLLALLIPVYLLAIAGLPELWKSTGVFRYYLFALLLVYPIGVALQCNDWHSRFSMAIMPYLCWSAAIGARRLYVHWTARSTTI